jgi:2'-5' RNA ligase
VSSDERLRLFLALRLPGDVLDAVAAWQQAHLRGVRAIRRDDLHVTLAFLGHRPAGELDAILGELREAAADATPDLRLVPSSYRETGGRGRAGVGMIVFEDVGGGATALAEDLQRRLEAIGAYRRQGRPWLPHLTVTRFRERPGLRLEPPAVGTLVPSDAAAYLSRRGPSGTQEYEVLKSVALGG